MYEEKIWPLFDIWVVLAVDNVDFAINNSFEHLESGNSWGDLLESIVYKWRLEAEQKMINAVSNQNSTASNVTASGGMSNTKVIINILLHVNIK